MGTTYHISYRPFTSGASSAKEVKKEVDVILERVNDLMSTYRANSEISKFNRHYSTAPMIIDGEFFRVVQLAQSISKLSNGAFDITVGPAVNRWGFGPMKRDGVPSDKEVAKLLKGIGYHNITLDQKSSTLAKKKADIYIDLSAIAKGYGVDAVATYLSSIQSPDYMVEIGGEVRTKGDNQGKSWRLGVVRPTDYGGGVERVVHLNGEAMATSGDYRNFFKVDGKRFSHTIDPRTARPVTHHLASVSVVSAKGCAYADAMATTLNVLGEQKGYEFAHKHNIAALFIYRKEGQFVELSTQQMSKFLGR